MTEPMTLADAIEHARSKDDGTACGAEHRQLAEWLTELSEAREKIADLEQDIDDNHFLKDFAERDARVKELEAQVSAQASAIEQLRRRHSVDSKENIRLVVKLKEAESRLAAVRGLTDTVYAVDYPANALCRDIEHKLQSLTSGGTGGDDEEV